MSRHILLASLIVVACSSPELVPAKAPPEPAAIDRASFVRIVAYGLRCCDECDELAICQAPALRTRSVLSDYIDGSSTDIDDIDIVEAAIDRLISIRVNAANEAVETPSLGELNPAFFQTTRSYLSCEIALKALESLAPKASIEKQEWRNRWAETEQELKESRISASMHTVRQSGAIATAVALLQRHAADSSSETTRLAIESEKTKLVTAIDEHGRKAEDRRASCERKQLRNRRLLKIAEVTVSNWRRIATSP